MAAPSTTAIGTPSGIKLRDGFSSVFTFARKPNVNLFFKELKPPGYDGGPKIDQTTMLNLNVMTAAPQSLYEVTDASGKCAYDPVVYSELLDLINKEGSGTAHLPDGTTIDVWCYLQKAEPDALKKGSQPEMNVAIVVTNWDPTSHVEAGPVITSVTGT